MTIQTEKRGRVHSIRLSNPQKRNPLSADVLTEILGALNEAQKLGASVAVISGAGEAFSSGYTLGAEGRSDYVGSNAILDDVARLRQLAGLLLAIHKHPIVTIAQVHGFCVAGGTDLMLVCDVAVAAHSARIGLPNVRSLGISLLSTVWPLLVGPMRAKLMMYTGDLIRGAQAEEWGLVGLSAPDGALEEVVTKLADRFSLMSGDLLKANKLASNRALEVIGIEQLISSAVEIDTIAHFSRPVIDFWRSVEGVGLKNALKERDKPYAENDLSTLIAACKRS